MPPPRETPNLLEGPGDYDVTSPIHNDTYPAIDPLNFDLTGKAVFITGGSRGLGRAMVLAFTRAGASFIATCARSDMSSLTTEVAAAATSSHRKPPKFLPLRCEVSDSKSVSAAAVAVQREFGRCDIVINNAGILGHHGGITDTNPDEWWEILAVNLRGPYLISRAFLPLLTKSENPYLINITSVAAHLLNPTLSAYQTSKAALLRFSQLVHAEYGGRGVTTFAIHPGNCATDMMGGRDGLHEWEKQIFVDTPELSANTLVFLTSEKRPWMGGRYINVTWDMQELMGKENEIVDGDKLKNKFIF